MPCKATKLDVSLFGMKKSVDVFHVIKSGCASLFVSRYLLSSHRSEYSFQSTKRNSVNLLSSLIIPEN